LRGKNGTILAEYAGAKKPVGKGIRVDLATGEN
jgi:hypothetical protein